MQDSRSDQWLSANINGILLPCVPANTVSTLLRHICCMCWLLRIITIMGIRKYEILRGAEQRFFPIPSYGIKDEYVLCALYASLKLYSDLIYFIQKRTEVERIVKMLKMSN